MPGAENLGDAVRRILKGKNLELDKKTMHAIIEGLCRPHWYRDANEFQSAVSEAKKNNSRILIRFCGESWCPPCKGPMSQVFSTCVFGTWVASNGLVLASINYSPSDPSEVYGGIIDKYCDAQHVTDEAGVDHINLGVPVVYFLNANGDKLPPASGVQGYGGESAAGWITRFNQIYGTI